MAPVFIRSLALVWRLVAVFGGGSDPVGEFYLRIGTGPSPLLLIELGEVLSANKPTGAKKKSVPKKVDWKALEIVHPDAAGIDVGGSEHWVAVSPDRDPERVRCFGCFTADLQGRCALAGGERGAQRGPAIYGRVLDARV